MPDVWTHILFGEEVLGGLSGKAIEWAKLRPKLFRFACQGPDFFFYYRFWPWQNSDDIDNIGRKIQTAVGGEFVRGGIHYAKTLQSEGFSVDYAESFPQVVDKSGDNLVETEEYQVLVTYLIGFICHYALDAVIHPYIHHKSGVYRHNDPTTRIYWGNHKILESTIDVILLKEKRGLKAAQEKVDEQFDLGGELPAVLQNFYQAMVVKYFHRSLKLETYSLAYRDMLKALRLFQDPHHLKKSFVSIVKYLSGGKINYCHFFYPHTVDNSVDYLNREKKAWIHPVDETEVYFTSFDELVLKAKAFATCWIEAMITYLDGKIDDIELAKRIPTLSFSTGKEPGENDELHLKYFAPIIGLK